MPRPGRKQDEHVLLGRDVDESAVAFRAECMEPKRAARKTPGLAMEIIDAAEQPVAARLPGLAGQRIHMRPEEGAMPIGDHLQLLDADVARRDADVGEE